jgi:hypothetical protein
LRCKIGATETALKGVDEMFGRMGVALLVGVVVLASFGWATDVSGDITTDTT